MAYLAGTYSGAVSTAQPRGLTARGASLFLLWVAIASSSVVFFEPAPFDALMAGLIVLLPLAGATKFNQRLCIFLILWVIVVVGSFIASAQSMALDTPVTHSVITMFLAGGSIVIASTLANENERYGDWIMRALVAAAVLASLCALAGYFNLSGAATELFTKHERGSGTFKDPNVYGAFVVPAFIYLLHRFLHASPANALVHAGLAGLLCIGLFVSFSRGAWANGILAVLVYLAVSFLTSQTHRFRAKLFVLVTFAGLSLLFGIIAILQIETVRELFFERASLVQSYDTGPSGRFGGQLKALILIAERPLGIGAQEFSRLHHFEDVHNVYLSMFLNSGWLGGFGYLAIVVTTLAIGLSHSFKHTSRQGIMQVAFASFAGIAGEGLIVDTDHWRHFFVIAAIVWGIAAANDRLKRTA